MQRELLRPEWLYNLGSNTCHQSGAGGRLGQPNRGAPLYWILLNAYPAVTLKQARDATPAILTLLTQGKRPREVEAERQREEERKRRDTFVSAIATFNEDKTLAGLRSGRGTEETSRREFLGEKWKRGKRTTESDGELATEWVKEWSEGPDPIWRKKPVNHITGAMSSTAGREAEAWWQGAADSAAPFGNFSTGVLKGNGLASRFRPA